MDIIFLNSKTGEQLTMPVTPSEFRVEIGRAVTQLDMAQTGQVNLPGLEALFNEQQTFLLPSSARNYTSAGYGGDPYGIVDTLTRWSQSGDVLRMIVTDTPVNLPVLLAPVRYGEQDGTGDVYVTLTMRQYRELAAETTAIEQDVSFTVPDAVTQAVGYDCGSYQAVFAQITYDSGLTVYVSAMTHSAGTDHIVALLQGVFPTAQTPESAAALLEPAA